MAYTLTGKTVFITGASSGIGEACARAFAQAGARLLLCARRLERVRALASELGAPSHIFALDVRDQAAVAQAIAALPEDWRAIDILVNNAGLSRGLTKLHEYDLDDINEMVDTNVKGLLYVTRAVLPGMVARGQGPRDQHRLDRRPLDLPERRRVLRHQGRGEVDLRGHEDGPAGHDRPGHLGRPRAG